MDLMSLNFLGLCLRFNVHFSVLLQGTTRTEDRVCCSKAGGDQHAHLHTHKHTQSNIQAQTHKVDWDSSPIQM